MDRNFLYPGQIPLVEQAMLFEQNSAVALGCFVDAVMGRYTNVADQFACVLSGLTLTIQQGSITSSGPVDGSGFSTLSSPAMAASIQYFFSGEQAIAIPAGATTSIYGVLSTVDGADIVLPYYNAATPSQPFAGQANSGAAQPTTRTNVVTLSTTEQTGAVLLYTVVVPAGATALTTAMITASSAFLPWKLPQVQAEVLSLLASYATLADLLAYVPYSAYAGNFAERGGTSVRYQPDGTIVQRFATPKINVDAPVGNQISFSFSFPVAFPNGVLDIFANDGGSAGTVFNSFGSLTLTGGVGFLLCQESSVTGLQGAITATGW